MSRHRFPRLIAALMFMLSPSSGCAPLSERVPEPPPPFALWKSAPGVRSPEDAAQYVTTHRPDSVRAGLRGGERVTLYAPMVEGDSLCDGGRASAVALSELWNLEVPDEMSLKEILTDLGIKTLFLVYGFMILGWVPGLH